MIRPGILLYLRIRRRLSQARLGELAGITQEYLFSFFLWCLLGVWKRKRGFGKKPKPQCSQWWSWGDLNPRPLPCQGSALPLRHSPECNVEHYRDPARRCQAKFEFHASETMQSSGKSLRLRQPRRSSAGTPEPIRKFPPPPRRLR